VDAYLFPSETDSRLSIEPPAKVYA